MQAERPENMVLQIVRIPWPALQDRTHPAPTKITIRELMAMTSGLSYDLESEAVRTAVAESQGQAGTGEHASPAPPLSYLLVIR